MIVGVAAVIVVHAVIVVIAVIAVIAKTQGPRSHFGSSHFDSSIRRCTLAESYRGKTSVAPAASAGRGGIPRGLGKVDKLEILKRGRSGRVVHLRLHAARGEVDLHGELKIRRALGNLRSSLFMMQVGRDPKGHFRLVGGGHGHGVGMCQHGAMGMAKAGKRHADILSHYYRGSQLVKLW